MSRRLFVTFALAVLGFAPWSAREARAQERSAPAINLTAAVENAVSESANPAPAQFQFPIAPPQKRISPTMMSLYASTAIMQGLDVHSTLLALDRGAAEANPLMKGIVKNKAAFITMKAGIAAATIMAARHTSKRNRVAAVVSLVAINSAYAMIVNHNYKVARGR